MTKVSVIILTKNSQKHIRTCIESILKQNYTDLELLVIDAGWVNAIFEVLMDKELRQILIKKCLEQSKKFTWEKTAKETVKVYEKIYIEES